ncbi:3-hydroxyacyl-CoA dehydrogenase NAD-binding domain-containing protein [Niveispirillum fermenti]|uniref:3-hydroxyacyl-CoA dehydrogenase NAD-binding domain-containing protein n=1 Tax=Niveispirillum fermenti TaxID=1233113 RepID=UPI003A88E45A
MQNFTIETDADGIALVTFDVPGRSMNTLSDAVIAELPDLIETLKNDGAIKGVVLCSGKASGFCAGADLGDLGRAAGSRIAPPPLSALFRRLEVLGKPVAVALEGLALGGGLELALSCHYRVAADSPKVRLGLPEVTVGLLPGAGGTQRLPRLTGVAKALPLLLEGRPLDPAKALALGVVDELVPADETVAAAKRWLREKGDPVARWDRKDYRLPGGLPYSAGGMQAFIMANATLRKRTFGNYPAPENILKCVFEGVQVPIDAGLKIETNYFLNTFATPQAKGMVRSLFLSKQALDKGDRSAKIVAPASVAVIGAGMMGAGIAYSQALKGINTILVDVSEAAAEKGKDYARKLVAGDVAKGRLSEAAGAALLDRIIATADYAKLADADLVVEAVFEDVALKHEITRRVQAVAGPGIIIGSNTSTLPITGLAQASERPENFVGIHFFSPVDKMHLVEIIRGAKTSEETVARATAYAMALGKTPIVVNDSRGFYTSRCFGTYIYEGLEMLMEGIPPALIDNAGRMTGMPRGPLELTDDVAVDLTVRIAGQTRSALGDAYQGRPYEAVLEKLVALGRSGRKVGAGFYDYPAGAPKRLWRGLADLVPAAPATLPDVAALKQRLLHRQALEAARCVDEGVIADPRAADVGAIMGWGFAPWTGGPLSCIDAIGTAAFVAQCDRLAEQHGERFTPPPGLRAMAADGRGYYAALDAA